MSSTRKRVGGYLWITVMVSADYDEELARIAYAEDGASETFRHAQRVFKNAEQGGEALATGDVIVTLLNADGDSTEIDPLRIPANQSDWFMDEWLKVPKSWRATPSPSKP